MALFTKKRVVIGVLVLIAGAAVWSWQQQQKAANAHPENRYRTASADTGNITQLVTASGTLNPVELINVGSQVSGTVAELLADFNQHVKKGQVLLKLDPTLFNAQIKQAEAALASAQASRRLAAATLDRNRKLVSQNYISPLAMDQAQRELDVADANIKVARAQLESAQANLNNSVIRAPIDGVIIKRTIDLGQTVAASFQTPNLFQIARDLTHMQIDTNVSEADVGALKSGQIAHFVVDAYPDREFQATLRQFRLAANVQQNVVTYNVVLDVDNQGELLKPGMTAQVRLQTGVRERVFRIPTAALRYKPSDAELARLAAGKPAGGANASASASASAAASSGDDDNDVGFRSKKELSRSYKIYRLDAGKQAQPVDVQIGLSNFRYTEIVGGPLKVGDAVVLREADSSGAK